VAVEHAGGITAVILDDHPAIVAGVQAWCAAATPPIEVIDAGDHVARVWTGAGGAADVVIFDLQLGGRPPAFRDLERLVDAGRRVIVYSQRTDGPTVLKCLDIGVFTYLSKVEGQVHLVPAVHAAVRDDPYTSPSLSGAMCTDDRPDRPALSGRERDVLTAWFESASKDMVAAKLGIRPKTVETYIERVRIKYANVGRSAPTKDALVRRALEDGLLELDDHQSW
jgi:DNA-binding NarL/FixJ family response regulator